MLNLVYTLFLIAWVVFNLPKAIYKKIFFNKDISLLKRFSIPLLELKKEQPVIWLHAVSLGEMKLAFSIIKEIQQKCSFQLVVTTQTKTGYEFAKSVFIENVFYLPIDLPFIQKRLVEKIKPNFFFLVESDFWYQQLKFIKKFGAKLFLLNGKISDRSFFRWKKIPKIAAKVFNIFDALFVQDDEMRDKFCSFVEDSKIYVTGNLKLVKQISEKRDIFPFLKEKKIIAITCTHENEEVELYKALSPLIKEGWTLVFAPRHPERFESVYSHLKENNQSTLKISESKLADVLLVDRMGVLSEIYKYSSFVVMGGSYSSKKGGHDIFEPILAGVYVYFGPYMQTQKYLKKIAEENNLAEEKNTDHLLEAIRLRFIDKHLREAFDCNLQNFKEKIESKKSDFIKKIKSYLSA